MPHRYDTDYEVGQDNIRTWGMDIHNLVFLVSALLVLLFVAMPAADAGVDPGDALTGDTFTDDAAVRP